MMSTETVTALTIARNILNNTKPDNLTTRDIVDALGTGYGRISHVRRVGNMVGIFRDDYQEFELRISHPRLKSETVAYYSHELGDDYIVIRNAGDLASLIYEIMEWATLPEQMDSDLFFAHLEYRFPEEMDGVVYPRVAALLAETLDEKLGKQEADRIFQEVLEKVMPQPADY